MVEALLDELELRMPERPLVEPGGAVEPGQSFYLARIRPREGRDVELLFVGLDGRIYERRVSAVDGDRAWPTASEIVALLQSLEPRCEASPPPPAMTEPSRAPSAEAPPSELPGAPPLADAAAPAPRWSLEPAIAGVAVFGVAPSVGREGPAGYGGALGLVGLSPGRVSGRVPGRVSGRVVVRGDARILGARRDGWWIVRIRLRAGAGFRWARERVGVELSGGGFVEPWVLGREASTTPLHAQGTQRRAPPLLGLWGRVEPFFSWEVGARGGSLALGPALELAAGGAVDGGVRTVVLRQPAADTPVHRLGGLELSAAITLRLRPGPRGPRRAPP